MNNLYLSRDLWYLALCCLGFSAACIITIFISRLTEKQRNRTITGAILWGSGMVVFLTLATLFSNGKVFLHQGFYLMGSVIFVLSLFSWMFPRHFGFPFVIAAGFFVVAFAFFFLRFPLADKTDPLVFRTDEANQAAVRILRSVHNDTTDSATGFASFQLVNTEDALAVNMYEFRIDEAIPFVGGQVRSSPAEIMQNNTVLYTNPIISRIPLQTFFKDENRKRLVSIREYQRNVSPKDL